MIESINRRTAFI